MSTRYEVQNNQKGYWICWSYTSNRDDAIVLCKRMNTERPKDVKDICSWRVVKFETVHIYPLGTDND